jgi:hypothetical protein
MRYEKFEDAPMPADNDFAWLYCDDGNPVRDPFVSYRVSGGADRPPAARRPASCGTLPAMEEAGSTQPLDRQAADPSASAERAAPPAPPAPAAPSTPAAPDEPAPRQRSSRLPA